MAKETWGEACDAVQQEMAELVLVEPIRVVIEMLTDAFSFGSSSSGGSQSDEHCHCYPCHDADCDKR